MSQQDTRKINKHIFVSYAHENSDDVLAEVEWLKRKGLLVWLDREITPGSNWAESLATAIDDSAFLLFFATRESISSAHCQNEIAYALDSGKIILAIFNESLELHGGLKLTMSRTQAIMRWQLSDEEFRAQLEFALSKIIDAVEARQCDADIGLTTAATRPRSIWQVPLHRNFCFTGRQAFFNRIESAFNNADRPVILALTGLGGVGKSQLALEYAHRYRSHHHLVAWIRAESIASIESDLVALAAALGLSQASDADMSLVTSVVMKWLENNDDWFLILDNAASAESIQDIFPARQNGHILITSRNQQWGGTAQTIPVPPFTLHEAKDFVLNWTGQTDEQSALKLAVVLGGLPLALEEACAYMEACGRSIASYLKLFNSHHEQLLTKSRPLVDYPATLQTTWEVSFQELENTHPDAAKLLYLLAFVGSDDVSESLLLKADLNNKDSNLKRIDIDSCITALRRYSFIKVDHGAASVHRLVQMVTRDRMSERSHRRFALKALQLIEAAFPMCDSDGDMLPDCGRLLPHAIKALEFTAGDPKAETNSAQLLVRTGNYMCARGAFDEGIDHLDQAYRMYKKLGVCDEDFAHACQFYSRGRYQGGHLRRAKTLAEEAVQILSDLGNPDGVSLPRCLTVLAWICWSKGDIEDGKAAAGRASAIISRQTSMADPRTLSGQTILARLLLDEGRLQEALEITESCLASITSLGGARHPIMCGAFLQIAQVLLLSGQPLRALSWAQESLSLGGPAFGEHHPLVSGAHSILGQILAIRGEHELALAEFSFAVDSVARATKKVSQHSAIAHAHMIHSLINLGRIDDAWKLTVQFKRIANENIAGDAAYAQAFSKLCEARIHSLRNQSEPAIAFGQRADIILCQRFGENHLYRVPFLCAMGFILRRASQFEQSREALQKGLDICSHYDVCNHPYTADCLLELAKLDRDTHDRTSQITSIQNALSVIRTCTGPSSAATMILEQEIEHDDNRSSL